MKKDIIEILPLTEEFAKNNSEEILDLEYNWVEIGDELWKIENLLYPLESKWELSHVAKYNGKIVGYQIGSIREGKVFLNKIIVDKNIRGLGIGKQLLRSFLQKSSEKGVKNIIFRVRTDNPAVGFYEKLGFTKNKEIDRTRKDGVESYFYDSPIKSVINNLK